MIEHNSTCCICGEPCWEVDDVPICDECAGDNDDHA